MHCRTATRSGAEAAQALLGMHSRAKQRAFSSQARHSHMSSTPGSSGTP